MKTWKFIGTAFFLATMVLFALAGCKKTTEGQAPGATPTVSGDDPVWVTVNGQDIKKSEIEVDINRFKSQMGAQLPPEQLAGMESMIKREAMQRAVQRAVLDQTVAKLGIKPDQAKIDEELKKLRDKFPDPGSLEKKLAELNITEDDLKKDIGRNLSYQEIFEKNVQVPEPSEEKIQEVYDRAKDRLVEPAKVNVTQIVLTVQPSAAEETKKEKKDLAESIRKKILAGEDVAALVQKYSDEPADNGKKTYAKGSMPESFDNVVFALKAGEVSPVIETPMGYHVVRVDEIVPEKPTPLEEVRSSIIAYLKEEDQKKAFDDYMQELMKKSDVKYIEPLPVDTMHGMEPPPPGAEGAEVPAEPAPGATAQPTAPEAAPAPAETAPPAPAPEAAPGGDEKPAGGGQ